MRRQESVSPLEAEGRSLHRETTQNGQIVPKQPEKEAYARQIHKDFTDSEELIGLAYQQLVNTAKTVGIPNKEGEHMPT